MKNVLSGLFRSGSASALALVLLLFGPLGAGTAHAVSGTIGPLILGLGWHTDPFAPCHGDEVRLVFDVCECAVDLVGARRDSLGPIVVHLRVQPDVVCVTCIPDTAGVDLGALAAGMHSFQVRVDIEYVTAPDSVWPASPVFGEAVFAVGRDCPPPPGPVPYLESVVIENGAPCPTCPARVCPGDSIDVRLRGHFNDSCHRLIGVSLVPNPSASPLPLPPVIRLSFGDISTCSLCSQIPNPWEAHVRLPGQPYSGGQVLPLTVEAEQVDLCSPDSVAGFLGRADFPFVVAESCSTGPGSACFNVSWRPDSTSSRCDATYGKTHAAELVFRVGSTVPVAGVQGRLRLDSEALHIASVGTARDGWVVQTSPNPAGGLDFIAFATSSTSVIPGRVDGLPQPLLDVRVDQHVVRSELPAQARLGAFDLLVSDTNGQALRMCPIITLVDPPPTVALLCRDSHCDANADGLSDVRDLVLMVQCLDPPPNVRLDCPLERMDCDASGGFDLEDVFCCVRHMLGGDTPTPGDSARAEPAIAALFGAPVEVEGTVEVPLSLLGLSVSDVVAARFDVAYPDDRYDVVGVSLDPAAVGWWLMHDVAQGRLRLALLDLTGIGGDGLQPVGREFDVTGIRIHLRPRDGTAAGGELAVTAYDLAAADGASLTTPNARPNVALGPAGRVALTTPRPNPFGGSTAFTLTLPASGPVDVGIFDVAGRRVVTLLREASAPAGVREFSWNGIEASGARAARGVYFVRVVTGAGDTSRKILFLPGATR